MELVEDEHQYWDRNQQTRRLSRRSRTPPFTAHMQSSPSHRHSPHRHHTIAGCSRIDFYTVEQNGLWRKKLLLVEQNRNAFFPNMSISVSGKNQKSRNFNEHVVNLLGISSMIASNLNILGNLLAGVPFRLSLRPEPLEPFPQPCATRNGNA